MKTAKAIPTTTTKIKILKITLKNFLFLNTPKYNAASKYNKTAMINISFIICFYKSWRSLGSNKLLKSDSA